MTDRLKKIFEIIPPCDTFADIGCDHGYIASEMIKSGKCKKVVISDVSKKCLSKAERLLSDFIESGDALPIVSDGFDNLPAVDLALIAGMGGREIISILTKAKRLPNSLVVQPMKNLPEVRREVVKLGYKILIDKIFYSEDKFYNIILVVKGFDVLSDDELEFGRTNILERSDDFKRYLSHEIKTLNEVVKNPAVSYSVKEGIVNRIKRLSKYA